MKEISGIAASPGVAIGPVYHIKAEVFSVRTPAVDEPMTPEAEWSRLLFAIDAAHVELDQVLRQARLEVGDDQASIFHAQSLMLGDPDLLDEFREAVFSVKSSAEIAASDVLEQQKLTLLALDDEYFRARAADVEDIRRRLVRLLLGKPQESLKEPPSPAIVIASDLTPSDTMLLDKSNVLGFCLAAGGRTSHVAILARSLGLPAVVGIGDELALIPDKSKMIIDGTRGMLVIDPDTETKKVFLTRQSRTQQFFSTAKLQAEKPAITLDGHQVIVMANVANQADAHLAVDSGAEGVGLFRSEFLFLERDSLPGEDEQFRAYRGVMDTMDKRPVVLRTMDIGGDKQLGYLDMPPELNPFLGCRAIRLSLSRPQLLKTQLRSALRAGYQRNLGLLFPMVSLAEEVRQARKLLQDCQAELIAEGLPMADKVSIGIMVEIPAAALTAELLAKEVDFFSIGTNDLAQYTMAADRTNPSVNHLCDAFHPAVLKLIHMVTRTGAQYGKMVAVCGELAGEPLAIPILLGLGVGELSMNPLMVPVAKQIIRSLRLDKARQLVKEVIEFASPDQVRNAVESRFPWIAVW
ncbi:MAG: phosphoenolpyruvate--protein phosphotransferase [Anaerolineales bacterium]|nr:phosphoenolpyruvate--protein phosphotransferase [Anaerolineales bacterium]